LNNKWPKLSTVDWRQKSDEQYARLLVACRPPIIARKTGIKQKGKPQAGKVLNKPGDSYIHTQKDDGKDIFKIKDTRLAERWQAQAYPVMLVTRTSEGQIRWMNVTDYLQKQGEGTIQIVFDGEPFTALNLVRLRNRLFR
jgi:hypothetical protein